MSGNSGMSNPKFAYLYAHAFEALIALAAIISGVSFFVHTNEHMAQTPLGRALPGMWDDVWNLAYVLGGTLILIGLTFVTKRIKLYDGNYIYGPASELAGLIILASAVLINATAILIEVGVIGSSMLHLAVVIACALRSKALISSTNQFVLVEVPGPRNS
jgi:hypothetical protein